MNLDQRSRPLVTFTVVFLGVYAPVETWGGVLRLGLAELWFVAIGTVIALGALAWSLRLITARALER